MKTTALSLLFSFIAFTGFSQCTPYAGMNQETCDQSAQLNADTLGFNIISLNWTSSIAGVIITPDTIPNPIVSIASMAPTIYGDSGQVTVWFYLNSVCSSGIGSDSVSVTFYQVPVADAGGDDSTGFSSQLPTSSYLLSATYSIPNNNTQGQWSYIPSLCPAGATVSFTDSTDPNTDVTVSLAGDYYLTWTEWNTAHPACNDTDTVMIWFLQCLNIDCGLVDTSVCSNWVELDAINSAGLGQWGALDSVAYASYPSIDSLNSAYQDSTHVWVYHPTLNDTVTLYWTEYTTFCVYVDSVSIYFAAGVPAVPLVQDSTNCGLVFTGLDAQTPQYGYGYWIDTVPYTQFYDTAYSPHPDSAVVQYYGMHHFYWIVNNGACIDTSDVVPVLFIQNPIANAGGNFWTGLFGAGSEIKTDTACGYDYYLWAQSSIGTGTWHTIDQVNTWFLNPNASTTHNPHDTAHTNILTYNTNPDHYDFVWFEDNGHGCTDQDTLRLFFAPIPTGDFTTTQPWCTGYPSTIIAHTSYNQIQNDDWGLVNFNWTLDGGIVDTTGGVPITGMNEDTLYVHWDNGYPSHIISLLTVSQYGCTSPISFDTIIEPPAINPDYDIEDATCGQANGIITLHTNNNQLIYTWEDDSCSCSNDTVRYGLLGNQTFTVYVSMESLSPDAPQGTICSDILHIYLPDTGYTTALFDTLIPSSDAPYSTYFTNLSTNGYYYDWFVYNQNNQLVWYDTTTNPFFSTNQVDCYHIMLVSRSIDNCRDTMQWGEFCVYPTGIETGNIYNIQIFPTFSTGTIFIESPQDIITGITVTDFTGRVVKNENCNDYYKQIDLKTEPAGIYFVTVKTKNSRIVKKVILEH